jgi:anti-sigma factor RsiW
MTCDWSDKLDRYADYELSEGEMAEFQRHLLTCPTCAAGALSRLQMKRMTQSAVSHRYRPPAELRLKIEQSITTPHSRRWMRGWLLALATAAAAFLLIVASADIWLQHVRSEQALSEIADLHVSTLASPNPVDVVSTDRHTVKPWFQGKLSFTFNLPDLQNSPFRLVGGRLAYLHQNPGAQLLFELRKHQISVFIFRSRADTSSLNLGSALGRKLTFSSETWEEDGLRYFVVGDCNTSDLHDLSQLLRNAARP